MTEKDLALAGLQRYIIAAPPRWDGWAGFLERVQSKATLFGATGKSRVGGGKLSPQQPNRRTAAGRHIGGVQKVAQSWLGQEK